MSESDLSPEEEAALKRREKLRKISRDYRESVFNVISLYHALDQSLSGAELFDSSWSDSDYLNENDGNSSSEKTTKNDDEHSIRAKSEKNSIINNNNDNNNDNDADPAHSSSEKSRHVAQELLTTEHDYVSRLHLLHEVFYLRLEEANSEQPMFPTEVLTHMFMNIRSIYLFHHDFLLPQLEGRMKQWNCDPRIGDLMKQNAPFLKMYSEYIRNFDQAMNLLNHWMGKSSRFMSIIKDIRKLPECGKLSLQHHMLGPIQRVPRYELLLKDYIKHLPASSPDSFDAKDALELVARASSHSNEALKKTEKFRQLLDIHQSLRGVSADFISPTRELTASGPIIKISARTGEKQQRHIFLFNDVMLVCTHYMRGLYNVRSQMELEGLEIKSSSRDVTSKTFTVQSDQKVVKLLDENQAGEEFGWEEKIRLAKSDQVERRENAKLKESRENSQDMQKIRESYLGTTAPSWMQDDAVSTCTACQASFSVFRRRHHCRACGKLTCKSCCKKAPLEYRLGQVERVCSKCHHVIVHRRGLERPDPTCHGCLTDGLL